MRAKSVLLVCGVVLCVFCAVPVFAQATFSISASTANGADIGATELTGGIIFTVMSGSTVPSSFVIHYSAPLTITNAADINLAHSWGSPTVTLDRDGNNVLLSVPGGGGAGNVIQLTGVRVGLAGHGYTNVTATVTSATGSGNQIAGDYVLTVINSIQHPFTLAYDQPLSWRNGMAVNPSCSIHVTETYTGAFPVGGPGVLGQTVKAQLRFTPIPSIPSGITVTFPATVTAPDTLGSFTTTSGNPETIPGTNGKTSVTYEYTGPSPASFQRGSFNFLATLAVQSPATTGSLLFQAALLPIGIEVPNSDFPSADIPRYTERLVPDETDLGSGSSKLIFPFEAASAGRYTGMAITNPQPLRVRVTLTAYNPDGTSMSGSGITNPAIIEIPRMGQYAKLATEVFGSNFNASSPGTIVASAQTQLMPGLYMQGAIAGQGLDGGIADPGTTQRWVWPSVAHDGTSPFTIFRMYNPGTNAVTATLNLYDRYGSPVSPSPVATISIAPGGTAVRNIEDVFTGVNLNSFAGGYVTGQTGQSDGGLVVSETFGNALEFNILQGQSVSSQDTLYFAHFASGGGYATELNLINRGTMPDPVTITLTAFNNAGVVIGSPAQVTIGPGAQILKPVDQIFPSLGSSLTSGYIRADIPPVYFGPFPASVPVTGSIRFSASNGSSSAALPLLVTPAQSFVYSHVAQDLGYFTGIVALNLNTSAANLTVQVYDRAGTSVGSAGFTLQPGQRVSELLYQRIALSSLQVGGYVQIQSDQPVISFALFGTSDGKVLSAIPPQRTDQ